MNIKTEDNEALVAAVKKLSKEELIAYLLRAIDDYDMAIDLCTVIDNCFQLAADTLNDTIPADDDWYNIIYLNYIDSKKKMYS